MFYLPRCC